MLGLGRITHRGKPVAELEGGSVIVFVIRLGLRMDEACDAWIVGSSPTLGTVFQGATHGLGGNGCWALPELRSVHNVIKNVKYNILATIKPLELLEVCFAFGGE